MTAMISKSCRLAVAVVASLVWSGASTTVGAQESPRPVEIMDQFRIHSVSSPAVSPDGRWLAYIVGETDYDEDERSGRIWMQPFTGGEPIPMTMEGLSAGSPEWSPDGKWLSFAASRNDEEQQVWALDRRGGEARQLTSVEQGIDDFEWSPDGRRLLLSITDEELPWEPGDTTDAEADDEAAGDDAAPDEDGPRPAVIDRLQFKRDYRGYLDRRRTHLYVWELETESLTQITDGDYDDAGAAWSPDGRQVVFVSNRGEEPDADDNSDLWIVDVPAAAAAVGDDRPVPTPRRLTSNPGPDGSPAWSPDGRLIAYTRSLEPKLIWYDVNEIAVVSPDGGRASIAHGIAGPERVRSAVRSRRPHLVPAGGQR